MLFCRVVSSSLRLPTVVSCVPSEGRLEIRSGTYVPLTETVTVLPPPGVVGEDTRGV